MSLQTDAHLLAATADPPARADRSRLDVRETLLLYQLADAGLTQAQIAQRLGCDASTVSRKLTQRTDTREHALQYLQSQALTFAKRVVDKADVNQSLEVLDRIDVAPKKDRTTGSQSAISIFVGQPGQTALSPPTFAPINVNTLPGSD